MASNFVWGSGILETSNLGRWWKNMSGGNAMTFKSIPRHIHGHYETSHPRTELGVRYYPYKQEMTYNGHYVPTWKDVLYTHYFPRHLDDDERVAYVAEKTGRTEEDVANEMFKMRRIRMFCGTSMRMKLMAKTFTPPQGMEYSDFERKYHHATLEAARMVSQSWSWTHSFDPTMIYSPQYGFGDAVDFILEKPVRTALQYTLVDIVVDKGISRSRLTHVKEDAKHPLEKIEPCMYNYYFLKFSVMANIVKQEGYVTDHFMDCGHTYQGLIVHFQPTAFGEVKPEVILVPIDMELGRTFLRHYHENYVMPLRGESAAGL